MEAGASPPVCGNTEIRTCWWYYGWVSRRSKPRWFQSRFSFPRPAGWRSLWCSSAGLQPGCESSLPGTHHWCWGSSLLSDSPPTFHTYTHTLSTHTHTLLLLYPTSILPSSVTASPLVKASCELLVQNIGCIWTIKFAPTHTFGQHSSKTIV